MDGELPEEEEVFYGAQYYHLVVCSIEMISPSISRGMIVIMISN